MGLELNNITIRQGAFELKANWQVDGQKRLAIIGPSGAGKSTLLAVIAGFLKPAEGSITWQGQDITNTSPSARPVAMLFQDGNLFPHLTVWQNAALGVHPGLRLTAADRARVEASLKRVGLAGYEQRKPSELSGGQQSRVALARVLLQDKALILLDEPFAALGPALKAEMLELVSEIAVERSATVLMVSHDPRDAEHLAEEVILVTDGQAQAPRKTAELFANPPEALRAYLGQS